MSDASYPRQSLFSLPPFAKQASARGEPRESAKRRLRGVKWSNDLPPGTYYLWDLKTQYTKSSERPRGHWCSKRSTHVLIKKEEDNIHDALLWVTRRYLGVVKTELMQFSFFSFLSLK